MSKPTAYVPIKSDGIPFDGLAFAAYEGFIALGYDIHLFRREDMYLGAFIPTADSPVVGPMDIVKKGMTLAGAKVPEPIDYPEAIQPYLGRLVYLVRKERLLRTVQIPPGQDTPYFIKPAQTHKLFTGFVARWENDWAKIAHLPEGTPLWVSDVIGLKSEMRVFVFKGEIIHFAHYDGDPFLLPSRYEAEQMVKTYEASGTAPVAYALDVGLITSPQNGRTVLVEVNDAFALGPYTLANVDYARMLAARWSQIVTDGKGAGCHG